MPRTLRAILTVSLLAPVLAGCGGGSSGPPDEVAPEVAFLFPVRAALTDGAVLAVAVRANDDRGVASVRVNGVVADRDPGAASVFRASVPLAAGANDVVAVARDGAGNEAETSVAVECVGGILANPRGVAFDAAGGRAFVADPSRAQVFAVDLATGAIEPVEGFDWERPVAAKLHDGELFVADGGVVAVDLAGGAAERIGPDLIAPTGLAVDGDGRRCLVTDSVERVLLAIDLDTGDRTDVATGLASPQDVVLVDGVPFVADGGDVVRIDEGAGGAATVLAQPGPLRGVAHDPAGDRLLVTTGDSVVAVALADGAVSPFADGFSFPQGLAFDGARALVADSGRDALVAADGAGLADVVRSAFGTGPELASPRDLSAAPGGGLLVADFAVGIVSVGATRALVDGAGPGLVFPIGVAADGGRVLVADSGLPGVFDVELATGDRTVLGGAGPPFTVPARLAIDAARSRAVVLDAGLLVAVDLPGGDRTLLGGQGPLFQAPRAVAVDAVRDRLLVVDDGTDAVVSVDPATGDRAVLEGAGPALEEPTGIAVDRFGVLFVTDTALDAVVRVDPATGDRTVLAGSGPAMRAPEAVACSDGGLFVVDSGLGAVLQVDPATGERVIVSK